MKTRYFYFLMGLSLCLWTGCDDRIDSVQEEMPAGKEVRLTAAIDGSSTRMNLSDMDGKVRSAWEEGDSFQVYDAEGMATVFTLESGAGSAAASFVGTPQDGAYVEGEHLSAVYGATDLLTLDSDRNLTINLRQQNGQLNDRFMILYGETAYDAEGTAFHFKHVVSLLKVIIPTDKTLERVKVVDSHLYTQATLVLKDAPADAAHITVSINRGDLLYSYPKQESGEYVADAQNGIEVTGPFYPENGVVTLYLYVLPAVSYTSDRPWITTYGVSPFITATTTEGETLYATSHFDTRYLSERGKMYRMETTLFAPTDFPNEEVANGDKEQPYELWTEDDLYSWMMRCRFDMRNRNGWSYQTCNYVLKSDIVLTDKMPWTPFPYEGVFDGNGKTISGSIRSTRNCSLLFERLWHATVKDLTIDFSSIRFTSKQRSECFGVLAGECGYSTIQHCVNRTPVSANAYRVAGLVAALQSDVSMIACGNEGNLYADGDARYMGGLAGYTDGQNIQIETCYNTGNLTANYAYWEGLFIGGLVGYDAGQISLNACWTSGERTGNGFSMAGEECRQMVVNDIIGQGSFSNCFSLPVGQVPDASQIKVMNAAMENGVWIFNTNGRPAKDNHSSVSDIPAEDW